MIKSFHRGSASSQFGEKSAYMAAMFAEYQKDPSNVHPQWQNYFESLSLPKQPAAPTDSQQHYDAHDTMRLTALYYNYQNYGHAFADLNPLKPKLDDDMPPRQLDYRTYGFTYDDLDREFVFGEEYMAGLGKLQGVWTLRQLLDSINEIYCGKVGIEYGFLQSRIEKNWIRDRVEQSLPLEFNKRQKLILHKLLTETTLLEEFLHAKFPNIPRYSIDGLEGIIPALNSVIDQAARNGVKQIVIGTAARGRLNILNSILNYNMPMLLSHFTDTYPPMLTNGDSMLASATTTVKSIDGNQVEISLLPNPDYAEAVNCVVMGNVYSKQHTAKNRKEVMGILIHGDSTIVGKGVVYEAMQMQDLFDYTVGGTIHIVANNGIGGDIPSAETRSSHQCTDVAELVAAPVLHVNGYAPEELDWVSRFAADYRQAFNKDVFLDIIGFRRYGRNELEDGSINNPILYKRIGKKEKLAKLYSDQLIEEGVIEDLYHDTLVAQARTKLNNDLIKAKDFDQDLEFAREVAQEYQVKCSKIKDYNFDIGIEELRELGIKASTLPEDFGAHPSVRRVYAQRVKALEEGKNIDWALGEALTWAQMVTEGIHVRISGQDVQRGTFSHRHSVINEQNIDRKKYAPLNNLTESQETYHAAQSHLSEFGVLGFEYGFAFDNPNALVMWEAQFGDFANGAQVVIDNFIANGQQKWGTQNGIVVLLPHGYDGQGPEHSSCRYERFLQLSNEDQYTIPDYESWLKDDKQYNLRVVVPTTPANFANMLKRQLAQNYRRPLIVVSPKRMLRHKLAVSNIEDFTQGRVKRVLDEVEVEKINPSKVRKVLFCSGQVFYDLFEERQRLWETRDMSDIVIIRVEQLAPFPWDRIEQTLESYPNAETVQWVQEEHLNMGGYTHVRPCFNTILKKHGRSKISAIGRPYASATATGYPPLHAEQLEEILSKAMQQFLNENGTLDRLNFNKRTN